MTLINDKAIGVIMSDERQKTCNDCNHEENKHDILREPYGRLCLGCFDDGSNDPCRNFSK